MKILLLLRTKKVKLTKIYAMPINPLSTEQPIIIPLEFQLGCRVIKIGHGGLGYLIGI